jgi:hypothetical protein
MEAKGLGAPMGLLCSYLDNGAPFNLLSSRNGNGAPIFCL